MEEVLQIERGAIAPHWNLEDFLSHLRSRECIGMISEVSGKVVGYIIYELQKSSLFVLRLAVHPDWRCKGIGTSMIDKLKNKLSSHRRTQIFFQIDEENVDFQHFLKKNGFEVTEIVKNQDVDEYLFSFQLQNAEKTLDSYLE